MSDIGLSTSPPSSVHSSTMTVPTHGRLSVAMQRRPSVATGPNIGNLNLSAPEVRRKRVVLGRPARVFWDLESCHIAGPDYFAEIIRSIEQRVQTDTRAENFEIYAVFGNVAHLSAELYQELLSYDVNFNLAKSEFNTNESLTDSSLGTTVEDDLFQQISKYVDAQCQQTNLFPYVLLISGSVSLINRMQNLEKRAKIVYAVRKEKATDFHVSNLAYEYSATKGIDNHHRN
ncbi:hypothetical protein BV898_04457 [Hypsibius exemplaris]|uniref:NYN domain-containing protein n=1 Tax=Hypsibius exemplaris TaxID=2072580 RepID=A0A1W0X243_HYPEX|nr:hypothetical protein BV898_04457 [Hypsibius exemplaris]